MPIPPSAAERYHVHKLMRPEGGYEHVCPQKPPDNYRTTRKMRFRIMNDGKQSPEWFLHRPGGREYIKACPWCTEILPKLADLACLCGADDAVDHNGYGELIVRKEFDLPRDSSVRIRVRARIVEFIHDDDCPVRGMKTRGSY